MALSSLYLCRGAETIRVKTAIGQKRGSDMENYIFATFSSYKRLIRPRRQSRDKKWILQYN